MVAFGNKSPLETAIAKNKIEIWNIMRNGLELSEKEKLVQLRAMIECGRMEEDVYFEEFKELLSSLPVELVKDSSILIHCKGKVKIGIYPQPNFLHSKIFVFSLGMSQVTVEHIEGKGSSDETFTLLQV